MSVAGRGGVIGGVAAVIAALFYGAWTVSRPPVEPVGEITSTGTGEAVPAEGEAAAEAGEAGTTEAAVAEAAPEAEVAEAGAEATEPEAEAGSEAVSEPPAEAAAVADTAADTSADTSADTAAEADAEAGAVAEAEAGAETDAGAEPVPDAAAEVVPDAVVAPPSFDLVRVEKDGSALVAGAAMPGAMLSLRVTGEEIVSVPADGQGKFVAMFNLAPSVAPRVLSLVMQMPDGAEVAAEGSVVIAPTVAPVAVAAAPEEEPREEAMAEVGTPEAAPAPVPEAEADAAPAALLVTDEGAKVLQSAEEMPPELVANVTIDTITYTPEGAVQLAGRGTPERVVRLYLDNAPLSEAAISATGDWAVTLPEVAAGIYTLRADQVDAAGAVTSRFETPFKRETVEALAAASAGEAGSDAGAETSGEAGTEAEAGAGAVTEAVAKVEAEPADTAVAPVTVTVQPGFTLWQIASEQLGAGPRYVQVFEANKDQIRDPDLIYPGQVFAIPEVE